MLGRKGVIFAVVLLLAAAILAGRARLRLDDMATARADEFREMLYLPRGDSLKLVACGFDSPLADALFVKAMIYYGSDESSKGDKDAGRDYLYALFDVITDLSPRFARAYQMGSLFLTSSASHKADMDGVRLLEKGIANFDRFEQEGHPAVPDGRWLFHTLLATTYDVKILDHLRRTGDAAGAAEARRRAGDEFRLAASSPGAPVFLALAAAGYAKTFSGSGNVEDGQAAVLSVWTELLGQAEARGDADLAKMLENRIETARKNVDDIRATRELERVMSEAGRAYVAAEKRPPGGVGDLLLRRLLPDIPLLPLGTEEEPDGWIVLPDGSFRSRLLAGMNVQNHLDALNSAVIEYRRLQGRRFPAAPSDLVTAHILDVLPEPPLKALGQEYAYNPESGVFFERMPNESPR